MLKLKNLDIVLNREQLAQIPDGKVLINTINAHSYNKAQYDDVFADALRYGGFLVPDGASIVKACKWINARCKPHERIAGWDLFVFEMQRLERVGATKSERPKVMFMGSSEHILQKVREKSHNEYPNIDVITYPPPYKQEFTQQENSNIIQAINNTNPDLLWIGMTAPKQEKWTYLHWDELDIHCHVGTIGAVFDFFAGTYKRAPLWWQEHSLEWLYRFIKEPRRMWRRYILGIPLFALNILKEKFQ